MNALAESSPVCYDLDLSRVEDEPLVIMAQEVGYEPARNELIDRNHQAHRENLNLTPPEVIIQAAIDKTMDQLESTTLGENRIITLTNQLLTQQVQFDGSMSIAAASATKLEGLNGNTAFIYSVTRTGDLRRSASVSYAVTGNGTNPANAEDFGGTFPAGTINFAAGEHTTTLAIDVRGDDVLEANEAFRVTLSAPPVGLVFGNANSAGEIRNDDGLVSISAASAVKVEGNTSSTPFTFTVSRAGNVSGAASVNYAVSGIGANPAGADDFVGGVLPSGSVSFAANETTKTLTIFVAGDTLAEAIEFFRVTLSNPSTGMLLGTALANGQIQNDDANVSVSAASATKGEGNSGTTAFTFNIKRKGIVNNYASVYYAVSGTSGTGANPANAGDFLYGLLPSGWVSFAANETTKTVTIFVTGDTLAETTESFQVLLSNPSAGMPLGTAIALGQIQDDYDSIFFPQSSLLKSLP